MIDDAKRSMDGSTSCWHSSLQLTACGRSRAKCAPRPIVEYYCIRYGSWLVYRMNEVVVSSFIKIKKTRLLCARAYRPVGNVVSYKPQGTRVPGTYL